jgi:hypothetical protein
MGRRLVAAGRIGRAHCDSCDEGQCAVCPDGGGEQLQLRKESQPPADRAAIPFRPQTLSLQA